METQKVFFKKSEHSVADLGITSSFPIDEVTGISVRRVKYFQVVIILLSLFTGACNGPTSRQNASVSDLPVKVNPMLISQLGPEHFGNAIFRHGLNGPRIAASGNRILEFPVQVSAPAREVVPVSTEKYTNGACTFDVICYGLRKCRTKIYGRSI
jgi:hypothetical protein